MPTVFADAGYWIAIRDPGDRLHRRALAVTQRIDPLHIVTPQMVMVELFNHVSRAGARNRQATADFVSRLQGEERVEIIPQSDEQYQAARARYAARPDQSWSLTDCASFLIMEERGISEALAYDRDFEQAGFVALLREESG